MPNWVDRAISGDMKKIRLALTVMMALAVLLAPPLRAHANAGHGQGHGTVMVDGHGLGADHHFHFHDDKDAPSSGVHQSHNPGDHSHDIPMMPALVAPPVIAARATNITFVDISLIRQPAFLLERPPRTS